MPSRSVVLAVLGSLQLEFTRLAQITGNNKYFDGVQRVMNELEKWQMNTTLPGMWPAMVDSAKINKSIAVGSQFENSAELFTLGSLADSAYEYLPKVSFLKYISLGSLLTFPAIYAPRWPVKVLPHHVRKVCRSRQETPLLPSNDNRRKRYPDLRIRQYVSRG